MFRFYATLRSTYFLLCISISASAQIGAKMQQQGKIYGIWQHSQFGYQATLMLNPDGSGEFDGEPIKFSMQGTQLTIIAGAVTTKYNFTHQGNSLTLSGGDLDKPIVFSRSGTEVSPSTGTNKVSTVSGSASSGSVVGLWSGNGESIEFKADGTCIYLGNVFPYQISQGNVILTTAQGNATFGYAVKENQLTLNVNGQQVVYSKAVGGGGMGAQNNTATKGGVAMELVGQWCYMNMTTNSQTSRCVTLNADGTYIYSTESSRSVNTDAFSGGTASQGGDRGTWYVQGDRIYYNSQTSGSGSYRLEKRNHPKNVNDPMIVLDGEPYVTATLRNPWRY